MVRTSIGIAALASVLTARAQGTCGLESKCPESTPCCSQYGQCGIGAYCLGGCDPRSSFSLDSCVPAPVCESRTTKFTDLSRIMRNTEYLGDPSTADWVSSGQPVAYNNNVLLTMDPNSVGTLLASTTYMWYGNVKATFKTSRGQGVVTAFILLSDIKDEIDYEFVGVDLETAQTNYYYQGIPDYTNSGNITLSNTFANYHTYEIDWTPDTITWKIDGQVGRTKKRSDTWNATSNQWAYPQTPARVQLSLWPGGLPSNGQGTIDWAGGLVDWSSQDIRANGYYYAAFESVTMTCYKTTSAPGTNSGTSYTFDGYEGTNDTVVDGDNPTVLKSFLGSGLNMDAGAPSGTASGAAATSTAQTIPGLTGSGPGLDTHNSGASDGPAASPSPDAGIGPASTGGFSQGIALTTDSAGKSVSPMNVMGGTLLTALVAVVTVMVL